MIRLATNIEAHWEMVIQELERSSPKRVTFATFRGSNPDFNCEVINTVAEYDVHIRLLIGVGDHAEPSDIAFAKSVIESTPARVKILARSHLKAVMFERSKRGDRDSVIVGGRNLGRSEWHDLSYLVTGNDVRPISAHIQRLWNISGDARKITHAHLSAISRDLEELQELSSEVRKGKQWANVTQTPKLVTKPTSR